MIPSQATAVSVGRYLVSPLSERRPDGRFAASVSIRSGQGSGTHDRVLRLSPSFTTQAEAMQYAQREGLIWVHESASR